MPPGWMETTAPPDLPTGLTVTVLDNFGLLWSTGTVPNALVMPLGWMETTAPPDLPTGLTVL